MATYINPEILIWARKQQGYDVNYVMSKSGFSKLDLWESGQKKPTMNQLRNLAHFYRRPSALFFMKKPPVVKTNFVDFRVKSHIPGEELSPETRTEIRICESRRKKAIEFSELVDETSQFNLSVISFDENVEKRVINIRKDLKIYQYETAGIKNDKDALLFWLDKLEKANILVFRSITLAGSNPSFNEIRGISSYYIQYPWILINSQEHPRGQLFTLCHELAHLLLQGIGICTLDEDNSNVSHGKIEQFCNQFSVALLMPEQDILEFIKKNRLIFSNEENRQKALDKICKAFHVSREAAARRLETLRHVSRKFYLTVRKTQMEWLNTKRRNKSTGGDGTLFYKRVMNWNGIKYTILVLESLHQNKISLGEAAGALGTKVNYLEKIESELYG